MRNLGDKELNLDRVSKKLPEEAVTIQPEIAATAPTDTHAPDIGHFLVAGSPPPSPASTPFPLGL